MKHSLLLIIFLPFIAISNTPETIQTQPSTYSSIRFLWRKTIKDNNPGIPGSSILINNTFCKSISDPERAALGYIVTFIGSECDWEGENANEQRSNLKCLALTALNLGYQCSQTHIGFLQKWFAGDTKTLKTLDNCPTVPFTASRQTTFDEIKISKSRNFITIWYAVSGVRMGDQPVFWEWTETDKFQYTENAVKLVSSKRSKLKFLKD